MVLKRRWSELSQRQRRLFVVTATIDIALRVLALVDIRRRPASEIRGSKKAWAASVGLVNSAGALPLVYFVFGRRRAA